MPFSIPNPAGSATEKWQPTRWGVDPRTERLRQLLLSEGVDEGLATGFAMAMARRTGERAYHRRELLEEFSRWANTHTHEFVSSPEVEFSGLFVISSSSLSKYPLDTLTEDLSPANAPRSVQYSGVARLSSSKALFFGGNDPATSSCDTYDASTDTWSTVSSLPHAVRNLGYAFTSTHVYGVGGGQNGAEDDRLLIYNISADSWSLGTPMPTARYYPFAQIVNGVLYVIGGAISAFARTENEAYDIGLDSWSTMSPLPAALAGQSSFVHGQDIHVLGTNAGNRHFVYDTVNDTWQELANSPANFTLNTGGAEIDTEGLAYVWSGQDDFWTYDVSTQTWTDHTQNLMHRGILLA